MFELLEAESGCICDSLPHYQVKSSEVRSDQRTETPANLEIKPLKGNFRSFKSSPVAAVEVLEEMKRCLIEK
jgi:hypothetical protein